MKKNLPIMLLSLFVTMGVVSSLWLLLQYQNENENYIQFLHKTGTLHERIRYYDEVLTMSARMASFTHDKAWIKRYYDAIKPLDEAIVTAKEIFPKATNYLNEVDQANRSLIELEIRALDLVEKNKHEESQKVILSDKYRQYKQIYSDGLNNVLENIKKQRIQKEIESKRESTLIIALILAVVATSVFLVGMLFYLIRQQEKKLIEANERLEVRVKERTHELKMSSDRLNKAEEVSHLGSWDWNIVNNKLYWSDEIYRIFGIQPQEFDATYDAFLEYIHPEDRSKVQQNVDEALTGKPYNIEHRIVRKDGGERIVVELGSVQFDDVGKPVRMIGSVHDITEQRHLEEELHHSRKMEALGTLIGGIAHDFNNRLGTVTGVLYMANKEASAMPRLSERLSFAQKECFKVTDTIKQLITFAQGDLVQKKAANLNSSILQMLETFDLPHNITMHCDLCEEDLIIHCAELQIRKAIENILINAIDAMAESPHPEIYIKSEIVKPDRKFKRKHAQLIGTSLAHIEVIDNGIGIPSSVIEHIFEPFFTTKDAINGQGLGLSMAYGIINNHNGAIDIESSVGTRTAVHIFIPIIEEK